MAQGGFKNKNKKKIIPCTEYFLFVWCVCVSFSHSPYPHMYTHVCIFIRDLYNTNWEFTSQENDENFIISFFITTKT